MVKTSIIGTSNNLFSPPTIRALPVHEGNTEVYERRGTKQYCSICLMATAAIIPLCISVVSRRVTHKSRKPNARSIKLIRTTVTNEFLKSLRNSAESAAGAISLKNGFGGAIISKSTNSRR
ncbi:PIG-L family deacetylase [Babesia caballi]|uniref:PIG-L family deacetylase n=1 Tax=Babesia caballi TaxID=5871 RepID=A0AAV4LTZ8_BABCB|nr:PIG-L family deacetylase [Babesia caballi]